MLTLTKGTVPLPLSVSPAGDLKSFNHNTPNAALIMSAVSVNISDGSGDLKSFNHNTPNAALIMSAVSVNISDGSASQHALPVCGWQTTAFRAVLCLTIEDSVFVRRTAGV